MNPLNLNHNEYFVVGTDTEVGKTLISCALILKIKEQDSANKLVAGYKPVSAGTHTSPNGKLANEDVESLCLASNFQSQNQLTAEACCPFILNHPAAPNIVAVEESKKLSLSRMIEGLVDLRKKSTHMIVEGVGGFLVPLNEQETTADFAEKINLPIILVVGLRLGCLNHSLLTIEAIQKRNLTLAGWVANTIDPAMLVKIENIETLKKRIPAPLLGIIDWLPEDLQKEKHAPYSIEAMQLAARSLRLPG